MIRRSTLAVGLLALLAAGCATQPVSRATSDGTRFVLVRHAEKAADDPKDPSLSPAGAARALRLADMLASSPVTAVYATKYRRTQLTAAPTAASHHLDVRTYDAALAAGEFAQRLREEHRTDTVLVVGHSNTIPALAAALCECDVAPMGEDEFDRRIEIRVADDGSATMTVRRD